MHYDLSMTQGEMVDMYAMLIDYLEAHEDKLPPATAQSLHDVLDKLEEMVHDARIDEPLGEPGEPLTAEEKRYMYENFGIDME